MKLGFSWGSGLHVSTLGSEVVRHWIEKNTLWNGSLASIKKASMNPQGFMISIVALFYPNSRVLGHLASRQMFDEFQPNMRFNWEMPAMFTKSKARCHHWRLREAFHHQVQAFRQETVQILVCFCWLEDCLLKCIVGVWKKTPPGGGGELKKMRCSDFEMMSGVYDIDEVVFVTK